MSFKAELSVAGRTYKVYACYSSFEQSVGANGRPSSGVKGGKINFILEGTDDMALWDWIGDPTKKQDGVVTFYRIDQDSKFKELEFKGAYAMSLAESFCVEGQVQQLMEIFEQTADLDLNNEDEYSAKMVASNKRLARFHHRSRIAYCLYLYISAEKIKIDGVEHENRWA